MQYRGLRLRPCHLIRAIPLQPSKPDLLCRDHTEIAPSQKSMHEPSNEYQHVWKLS
jgi:hypothetical protein